MFQGLSVLTLLALSVIIWVRVVFRKTVVGDCCFDYLSGSQTGFKPFTTINSCAAEKQHLVYEKCASFESPENPIAPLPSFVSQKRPDKDSSKVPGHHLCL